MPCDTLTCDGESNPTTHSAHDAANQIVGDSLASGVAIMLAMTVIQRLVGLGRNILICWFLEPEDLGVWNLANSFLILVAPLVLFGVPATLVRYVEHYRQKGQLRSYLKRVFVTSALLTTVGVALILLNHRQVSWLAFGETPDSSVLLVTTISLVIVIAFNLLVELLTALRQLKSLALVQFWNSLLFAGLSIGLLAGTQLGPMAVIVACRRENLLTAGYSFWIARRTLSKFKTSFASAHLTQFWRRNGPFRVLVLAERPADESVRNGRPLHDHPRQRTRFESSRRLGRTVSQ
ncbi:MAG: oligosaccharide flippase family protein [Pirellulaceae bacterium]